MLKQCGVCKKQFKPCNDCPSTAYSWRKTVCCPEHSDAFIAVIEYSRGLKTKEDAKKVLKGLVIDYNDSVKAIVDEIIAEPKKQEDNTEVKTEVKKK